MSAPVVANHYLIGERVLIDDSLKSPMREAVIVQSVEDNRMSRMVYKVRVERAFLRYSEFWVYDHEIVGSLKNRPHL
jgi:hypothetical protein